MESTTPSNTETTPTDNNTPVTTPQVVTEVKSPVEIVNRLTAQKKFLSFRVLVVDDQHGFLVTMNTMLRSLGFTKIDVVNTVEKAIAICRKNTYDIYLFDYNIGKGMNGRQLMERLRANKRIPYNSVVMIVTGDNTRAMVLSAIEQEPDDYLIKPFSQRIFENRLLKAVRKHVTLEEVYKKQFEGDLEGAIEALKKFMVPGNEHETYSRCLSSAFYAQLNRLEEALQVVEEGLLTSNANFLHIQRGKIYCALKQYDNAINEFEAILTKHPLLMEALKYLTNAYLESNQRNMAMQTIKRAVLLSPMSVPLLSMQIELAIKSEDYLVARDSIALLLDVNKCYPNEVGNLLAAFVQCELQFVQKSNDAYHISNMNKQIKNIISRYRKNANPENFNSALFEAICQARIDMIKGENIKGKRALYKAYTNFENPEEISFPIINHMFLAFQQVGEYEIAEQIKSYLEKIKEKEAENNNTALGIVENSQLIMGMIVSNYTDDPSYVERKEKYTKLNAAGIAAYKVGKLNEALEFFKEALRKVPTNTNAILNKIQVLLDICETELEQGSKQNKKMQTLIHEIETSLHSLDGLNLTEAQLSRTSLLRDEVEKFKKKTNKS